eukprot:jgi/Tetstr1/446679/TSEL_003618.t1
MGGGRLLANLTSRSPLLMTEPRKLWFILDSNEISIRRHTIDRFATMENARLPRYNFRPRDPCREATDSMRLSDGAAIFPSSPDLFAPGHIGVLTGVGNESCSTQLDAASGIWTVAIPATARAVMTPHELREAVPLGNTVPMDELKDLVPDAELSLPAFNVVTGSYDPPNLKSTLLEFEIMRYGIKYTAVPRATAVDRVERSLLRDIQRGLAVRDAAWHNTKTGQKGPLRDILDMSEYTGMGFGTVGEVSKGMRRAARGVACFTADRGPSARVSDVWVAAPAGAVAVVGTRHCDGAGDAAPARTRQLLPHAAAHDATLAATARWSCAALARRWTLPTSVTVSDAAAALLALDALHPPPVATGPEYSPSEEPPDLQRAPPSWGDNADEDDPAAREEREKSGEPLRVRPLGVGSVQVRLASAHALGQVGEDAREGMGPVQRSF